METLVRQAEAKEMRLAIVELGRLGRTAPSERQEWTVLGRL